jgi:lipopolysaccharide/colanic/teichoic acid biosynthesis glycosyltransferase
MAVCGAVVLSPVIITVAIISRFKLGKGVLFSQKRLGLHESPFFVYKFRSMTNEKDQDGNLLPDEDRITSYGVFLRKTSLDELPQLWNVLRGDMSIVGPRPLFVRYLDYYTWREKKRHSVRPGITGLAQVSGRNNLGWDGKLELDVKYVEKLSLLLDLKIIFKTVLQVVKGEDVRVIPGKKGKPLNVERGEKKNGSQT